MVESHCNSYRKNHEYLCETEQLLQNSYTLKFQAGEFPGTTFLAERSHADDCPPFA